MTQNDTDTETPAMVGTEFAARVNATIANIKRDVTSRVAIFLQGEAEARGIRPDMLGDRAAWIDHYVDPIVQVATADLLLKPMPELPIKPPREPINMENLVGSPVPDEASLDDFQEWLGEFEGVDLDEDEDFLYREIQRIHDAMDKNDVAVRDDLLDEYISERVSGIPEWLSDILDWDGVREKVRSRGQVFDLDGYTMVVITKLDL